MSAEQCYGCTAAEGKQAFLPQAIASQLEALRLERIRSFADEIDMTAGSCRSSLEQSVDSLLDSLNTMHQLDHLAAQAARGKQNPTDAERILIADNEETYRRLVAHHRSERSAQASVPDLFLAVTARPVR